MSNDQNPKFSTSPFKASPGLRPPSPRQERAIRKELLPPYVLGREAGRGVILFFYGADTFALQQELKTLKQNFSNIEQLEIDSEASDSDLRSRLQEVLEAQGLFAKEKLVILKDTVNKLGDLPITENYLSEKLSALPASITMVFAQIEPPDKRLRFFKKLAGLAKLKEFSEPSPDQLGAWIENNLKKEKSKIEETARKLLLQKYSDEYSLWQVRNDLSKLILLAGDGKTITREMVRESIKSNISQNVFDLTNLVAEGKVAEAVFLLQEMAEAPIQMVGALASQIRSLLMIKDLEGQSPEEIAKILGWKAGRVWINQKLSRKFSQEKLIQLLSDLKAIDYRLKTSEEPPKLLLTLFIQKTSPHIQSLLKVDNNFQSDKINSS